MTTGVSGSFEAMSTPEPYVPVASGEKVVVIVQLTPCGSVCPLQESLVRANGAAGKLSAPRTRCSPPRFVIDTGTLATSPYATRPKSTVAGWASSRGSGGAQ